MTEAGKGLLMLIFAAILAFAGRSCRKFDEEQKAERLRVEQEEELACRTGPSSEAGELKQATPVQRAYSRSFGINSVSPGYTQLTYSSGQVWRKYDGSGCWKRIL